MSSSYSELRQAHILAGHIPALPQYNNNTEGDYEPVIPPKGAPVMKHFKSLSNCSSDSDYFGTCVKCGDRIVGEGTGCSAMGRPYHILCFTCAGEDFKLLYYSNTHKHVFALWDFSFRIQSHLLCNV